MIRDAGAAATDRPTPRTFVRRRAWSAVPLPHTTDRATRALPNSAPVGGRSRRDGGLTAAAAAAAITVDTG